MGVLAEGNAIPDLVVPGIGELVDMGGVDDAARGDCQDTVSCQCAGIIVSGDNLETETGLPTSLARLFGGLVEGRADDLVFVGDRNAEDCAKARPLISGKILADQNPTRLVPEGRVFKARLELRIKFGIFRRAPIG